MNGNRRRARNGIRVNSQCFFVLIAALVLVYLHLLGDIEVPNRDDSAVILPSAIRTDVRSSSRRPTTYTKPPLEEYIQGWNITKPVNWLMNFAIVGAVSGRKRIVLPIHIHIASTIVSHSYQIHHIHVLAQNRYFNTHALSQKPHRIGIYLQRRTL